MLIIIFGKHNGFPFETKWEGKQMNTNFITVHFFARFEWSFASGRLQKQCQQKLLKSLKLLFFHPLLLKV